MLIQTIRIFARFTIQTIRAQNIVFVSALIVSNVQLVKELLLQN